MISNEEKIKHDVLSAVGHFRSLISLIETGFDFTTSEAKKMLGKIKEESAFLCTYMEKHYAKKKNI